MEHIARTENGTIKVKLNTLAFKQDDSFILFSPSLNISGYGDDEKEAKDSFLYILHDFINSNLDNKSLAETLLDLSWNFDKDEHPGQLDYGIYSKDSVFLGPLESPSELSEFETEVEHR